MRLFSRGGDRAEVRLVALLALQYYLTGIANSSVMAAGFALFFERFDSSQLPYVYIANAAVIGGVGALYLRLTARLSVVRRLGLIYLFLAVGVAAARMGLALTDAAPLRFALPILFQAMFVLGNLAVWTLAGRLLDLRQGKRLFGRIGSGYWLAAITAGLLVPPLVGLIGAVNLFLVAAVAISAAGAVMLVTAHLYRDRLVSPPAGAPGGVMIGAGRPGLDPYVRGIVAVTVCAWLVFYFVDNVFYDRAHAQYPDPADMARFLGVYIAAMGVLVVSSTWVASGLVLNRFGVRWSLLVTPGLMAAATGAIALVAALSGTSPVLFWLAAGARLADVALLAAVNGPSINLLYQPLPPERRSRAQALVESVVQPLAIGLAGVLLLAAREGLALAAGAIALAALSLSLGWAGLGWSCGRRYRDGLVDAIGRRHLHGSGAIDVDPDGMDLLRRSLANPDPGVVGYALTLLESVEPDRLAHDLRLALQHPSPDARADALARIERLDLAEPLDEVRRLADSSEPPAVRAAALRTLAAIGGATDLARVRAALLDEPQVAVAARTGLVKRRELDADRELAASLRSHEPCERTLALRVVGEAGRGDLADSVVAALDDGAGSVRRAASAALALLGSTSAPPLRQALAHPGGRTRRAAARALARVADHDSWPFLLEHLDEPDAEVRVHLLEALVSSGFRAAGPAVDRVDAAIRAGIQDATEMIAASVDLEGHPAAVVVREALAVARGRAQVSLFLLLACRCEPATIARVRDALAIAAPGHPTYADPRPSAQAAFAVELLELTLTSELRAPVLALVEKLADSARLARLERHAKAPRLGAGGRLEHLAAGRERWSTAWLRACAVRALAASDGQRGWPGRIVLRADEDPLVLDTVERCLDEGDGDMTLSRLERALLLKETGIFATVPETALAEIASVLDEVRVGSGTVICAKGDLDRTMYVVVSGRVRVHDGDATIRSLGARDVFGEFAILDPAPRSASVTAVDDTHLLALDAETFREVVEDHHGVAMGVIVALVRRLRDQPIVQADALPARAPGLTIPQVVPQQATEVIR